jgi:adenylate cyclase
MLPVYGRRMGANEEGTLAEIKSLPKTLIDPAISAHRGRIDKITGDGLLVEFASAVDAARYSTVVQQAMARHNAGVAQDLRIEFRIGIHVGDIIIIDDNDIFGDAVNIAARLESIAQPGGICFSDDAQRQIRGKVLCWFANRPIQHDFRSLDGASTNIGFNEGTFCPRRDCVSEFTD